jgi:hypothetical protein
VLVVRIEIDQRVGRQDEVLVRVERLARSDDRVPVARLVVRVILAGGMTGAGEEMRDQDGVRSVGIQRAVALPADLDVPDCFTTDRAVDRQREGFLLDDAVIGVQRGWVMRTSVTAAASPMMRSDISHPLCENHRKPDRDVMKPGKL